jgi:hypothetical protein
LDKLLPEGIAILTILSSVRSLLRGFRSSPGFLVVVLFTLAVGIGATAAIFTVVNAVLIHPLPFPEPERLVAVWNRAPGLNLDQFEHSEGIYLVYRRHNHVLEDLGIFGQGSVTLTAGDRPERVGSAGVTASVFSVLRVRGRRGLDGELAPRRARLVGRAAGGDSVRVTEPGVVPPLLRG